MAKKAARKKASVARDLKLKASQKKRFKAMRDADDDPPPRRIIIIG